MNYTLETPVAGHWTVLIEGRKPIGLHNSVQRISIYSMLCDADFLARNTDRVTTYDEGEQSAEFLNTRANLPVFVLLEVDESNRVIKARKEPQKS